MFTSRHLRSFIGIGISLVFLYLLWGRFSAMQNVHWGQVLSSVNPWYFGGGLALMVLSVYVQALRWREILTPMGRFNTARIFQSVALGHFINFILPMRAGEIARPFHFAAKNNLVFFKVAGTCITERLYDALAVLFLLLFCVAFLFTKNTLVYPVITAGGYVVLLLLLFIVIRRRWVPSFFWGLVPGVAFRRYLQTKAGELSEAFAFKYSGKKFAGICTATLAIWSVNVLSYWLVVLSCDLPPGLYAFSAGLAVTIGSAIAHSIPAAASGIGVLNYSVVFALESYAKTIGLTIAPDNPQLLMASFVVYLSVIIPDILLGGMVYLRDRKLLTWPESRPADATG